MPPFLPCVRNPLDVSLIALFYIIIYYTIFFRDYQGLIFVKVHIFVRQTYKDFFAKSLIFRERNKMNPFFFTNGTDFKF